ncbi:MAG: hypothetical protein WA354_20540 [Terracidiphilus sp.]
MNQLRQLMIEELRRRNFADTTIRTYLHGVAHFSRYFRRPPVPILACRTCAGTLADSLSRINRSSRSAIWCALK